MVSSVTTQSTTSDDFDTVPKLPPRGGRRPYKNNDVPQSVAAAPPKRPPRRLSPMAAGPAKGRPAPKALAPSAVGPTRRPPSRTNGFNRNMDLQDIPLQPISFDGKKIKEAMAQPLHEVVMERRNGGSNANAVSVVFAIRRPGCGQCRDHGIQLSAMCAKNPNVNLTGVIKSTSGINESIHEFYSDYFNFPLYKDEGWNLYNTIGNKKLSVYKLLSRAPGMEVHYAKKGIRNIPFGGDLFTQGGVLIFDRNGKLKFVYYETFGKPLDMEAIQWAIDEANEADDDQSAALVEGQNMQTSTCTSVACA